MSIAAIVGLSVFIVGIMAVLHPGFQGWLDRVVQRHYERKDR